MGREWHHKLQVSEDYYKSWFDNEFRNCTKAEMIYKFIKVSIELAKERGEIE